MGAGTSCCKKEETLPAGGLVHEVVHDSCGQGEVPNQIPVLVDDCWETSAVPDSSESPWQPEHPELSVDPNLVRGISLRRSLRRFGRIWQTKPSELRATDHRLLAGASVKVERFDMFVSHTWETSFKLKIWALTLQTGWPCVALSWLTCNVLVAGLHLAEILPAPWIFQVQIHDWRGWAFAGPWMRIAGLLSFVLGLSAAAYWPCGSGTAFVDVVSIDQSDPQLTARGVYGLGGFLALSSELRVLWAPPLFSRLWCIFELAAFRKANPGGRIVLAPLYVELLVGVLLLWLLFMQLLYLLFQSVLHIGAVFALVGLVPLIFCVHQTRKITREKRRLLADLKKFDLKLAQCSSDFDRKFIYAGISAWYGSHETFVDYVRGPVFQELVAPLAYFQVPFKYWLLIGLFELSSLLEFTIAFIRGGAPIDVILAQLLSSVFCQAIWRIVAIRLALFLSDQCSQSSSCGGLLDVLQTISIWLLTVTFLFASFQLSSITENSGLASSAGHTGFAVVIATLALGGWSSMRRCLSPK